MRMRGLVLLGLPIAALLGLFFAARSLRHPEAPMLPMKRTVRIVDGVEVAVSEPMRLAAAPSGAWPASTVRPHYERPPAADIAEAAELARIQSTYQNYRTAAITENEELRKSLLAVLRRDGAAAVEFAREDAELAETEADRAFARKLVAELSR